MTDQQRVYRLQRLRTDAVFLKHRIEQIHQTLEEMTTQLQRLQFDLATETKIPETSDPRPDAYPLPSGVGFSYTHVPPKDDYIWVSMKFEDGKAPPARFTDVNKWVKSVFIGQKLNPSTKPASIGVYDLVEDPRVAVHFGARDDFSDFSITRIK